MSAAETKKIEGVVRGPSRSWRRWSTEWPFGWGTGSHGPVPRPAAPTVAADDAAVGAVPSTRPYTGSVSPELFAEPAAAPRVSYTVPRAGTVHSAELEIKKSRFLALLTRVDTEDEARQFIARTASEHRDARHHCSAFLVGPHREIGRSSDDGEPAGTAGVPILQALSSHLTAKQREADGAGDLSDVCAVVVRWFGGIKLGAGGLVRAYSGAVTAALQDAPLIRRVRCRELSLPVPHADAGRVEAEIRARDLVVQPTSYGSEHAILHVLVPDTPSELDAARAVLATVTSGHGEPVTGEPTWQDVPAL